MKDAAGAAGLDEATLHRWMARGAQDEPRFRVLRRRVLDACETFERRHREESHARFQRYLDRLYGPRKALRG
jgi:hypothetical protein